MVMPFHRKTQSWCNFWHALLAFRLAVDINDYDLFVDLYHAATKRKNFDLADAAMIKAQRVFAEEAVDSLSEGGDEEGEDGSEEADLPPLVSSARALHRAVVPLSPAVAAAAAASYSCW